jgi:hypothetical protein
MNDPIASAGGTSLGVIRDITACRAARALGNARRPYGYPPINQLDASPVLDDFLCGRGLWAALVDMEEDAPQDLGHIATLITACNILRDRRPDATDRDAHEDLCA